MAEPPETPCPSPALPASPPAVRSSACSTAAARVPAAGPRYQPLVGVAAAAGVGIVADHYGPLPVGIWWTLTLAAGGLWLVLWRRHFDRAAAAAVLLATGTLGAAWHHCHWCLFPADDLGNVAREDVQPVALEAIALTGCRIVPPTPFDPLRVLPQTEHTRVEIAVTGVRDGTTWRPASGLAELRVDGRLVGISVGDRLRIFARLVAPPVAMNRGQWDFAQYQRAQRRRCLLRAEYAPAVSVVGHGPWSLRRLFDTVRQYGVTRLWQHIDASRSGLAAAVLLGAREQLDPEITEAYRETGTVHFLVIAGIHVGLLAGLAWFLCRRLRVPRGGAIAVVAGLTMFYALVVGMEPPVVRATILVLSTCLALTLGRHRSGFNALAAGALVVLAINPTDLFNVGAQLSFLSVAAVTWIGSKWLAFERAPDPLTRLKRQTRPWPLRAAMGAASGAGHLLLIGTTIWLVVLPLVMARFHLVTLIGPVLNAVLWVPLEVTMISGLGCLTLGSIPLVGDLCGWCCDLSLRLMEGGVAAGQAFRGGHFWVPGPSDWWLVGFYGALGLALAFPARCPPRRWCAALLAGWIVVGLATAEWHRPHASLECTILSVGHGGATVVELPSGQTLLYDAGQMNAPHAAARTIAGHLWSLGITHLDAVVLSHADVDHFNGLPELLTQISVGAVYVPPRLWDESGRSVAVLRDALARARVEVRQIAAGDRLRGGPGCTLEVLHPPPGGIPSTNNANSLVLGIEYQGKRILLPGDLESPGLDGLVAEEPWRCDVLMAPHHGSRRGQSPRLAAWCQPHWIVISGGRDRDFREIEAQYANSGYDLLHTARYGAVTIRLDAGGVGVHAFRPRGR